MKKKKAIFLDRDGVLNIPIINNGKSYAPLKFKDFRFYPNTKKNCKELKSKGYLLIVVTNQPDFVKKKISLSELHLMHKRIYNDLKVDRVYVSKSSSDKNFLRKPNPGMLLKAIENYNINIKKSFLIGDRKKDIDSAKNINLRAIFIDRRYSENKPSAQIFTCKSFSSAVKFILNK